MYQKYVNCGTAAGKKAEGGKRIYKKNPTVCRPRLRERCHNNLAILLLCSPAQCSIRHMNDHHVLFIQHTIITTSLFVLASAGMSCCTM
jgi:hypothetical protein